MILETITSLDVMSAWHRFHDDTAHTVSAQIWSVVIDLSDMFCPYPLMLNLPLQRHISRCAGESFNETNADSRERWGWDGHRKPRRYLSPVFSLNIVCHSLLNLQSWKPSDRKPTGVFVPLCLCGLFSSAWFQFSRSYAMNSTFAEWNVAVTGTQFQTNVWSCRHLLPEVLLWFPS